jgi:putative ABC transport system permease protein
MGTLWQDVRYGLRTLARSPGFTATALLVIGLGIGANTALFNALDQVYMRPLPVRKPHELASVQYHYRSPDGGWESIEGTFNYAAYETYREQSGVFAGLAAFTRGQAMNLRIGDEMARVEAVAVSVNYFSTLGVQPALGRLFVPEQEQSDAADYPVAVISHGLWRRQFAGKADVLGKQVLLDDRPLTIIGVTRPGFTGTAVGRVTDVYLPLGTYARDSGIDDPNGGNWLYLLGRLRPDVDREQAQAALRVLASQTKETGPDAPTITMLVLDGRQGFVSDEAQVASYPLGLFQAGAALVLLIACANIANLQLARAATRHKEIAVRRALGAGRRRILRQLLVESMLLALAAGGLGVLLALGLDRVICAALPRIVSANMDPGLQVHISPGLPGRVLLFAVAISLATGIAFGLTPALQMIRRNVVPALKETAGYADLPARRWNPHNLLVVAQITVAVIVMVCSGLCLRNLVGLRSIDPGFDPANVLAVSLEGWPLDRPELGRFMDNLHERVTQLPGVMSASLSLCIPLSEAGSMTQVTHIEGTETRRGKKIDQHLGIVSPGYFQTLGQALLAGRDFSIRDGPDCAKVTVVNEVMARRYWPNQNPIGKRVTLSGGRDKPDEVWEVVGVVEAVKVRSILEESRPIAYLPIAQRPSVIPPVLLIRGTGDPRSLIPAIRREVTALEPPLPFEIRTVAEQVSQLLLPQQILTGILNIFGFVGLVLSAMGIYAVMAYAVRQRTREIGIRMALGARSHHILASVLLRGAVLLIIGLSLGLGVSLAGARLLASLLPLIRQWDKFFLRDVYTWDPLTYVAAALVIAVVTLLACYLPARRAARIDPMVALRYE